MLPLKSSQQAQVLNCSAPSATSELVKLNAKEQCDQAKAFENALFDRVVAQDEAVMALSQLFQVYLANLSFPGKPIGTLLFLGPTGSGKTKAVEAAAEVLFGDPNAVVKVDCAEFQHSHEIAKLIGSPPGYLGHRETPPLLTQENLARFHTNVRLTLLLFDEIEKASDALWQLLLGVLDKATLTLGDCRRVDFSRCIVVLTSNLGAREMSEITEGKLGFCIRPESMTMLDGRLRKIAIEAARRKFSPEFMNRLDKTVVFNSLSENALSRILELELQSVQRRILLSGAASFVLSVTESAKKLLLTEGFDQRYGARPLKRAIERFIVMPLSNLVATRQVSTGDVVHVDLDSNGNELSFGKRPSGSVVSAGSFGSFASSRSAA